MKLNDIELGWIEKKMKIYNDRYYKRLSIFPRWCSKSGEFIVPFTMAYKLVSTRIFRPTDRNVSWINKDTYLIMKLKGTI